MDDEPGRGAPEPGERGERSAPDARPSDVVADAVDPDVAVHVDAVVAAHGDRVFDLCFFALGSPAEADEATIAVLVAVVLDEGPVAADLIDATAVDVVLDRAPRHGNPPAPSWPSSGRAVVDEVRASIASQIAPWTALERLVFALRVRHGRSAAAVALATGVREGRVDALCDDLAAGLSGESGADLADTSLVREVLPLVNAPAGLAAELRRRVAGRRPALAADAALATTGAGPLGPVAAAATGAAPRVVASTVGASVTTAARPPSAGGRFAGWRQHRAATAASFAAVAAGLALVAWGVTSFGAGSEPESVAAVAPSTTVGRGTTSDSPATTLESTERTDRVRRSTTSTAGLLFPPLPETTSGDLDGDADGDDRIDDPTLTGTTTPVVVTSLPPPPTTAPPGTVLTIPTTTPGTTPTTPGSPPPSSSTSLPGSSSTTSSSTTTTSTTTSNTTTTTVVRTTTTTATP